MSDTSHIGVRPAVSLPSMGLWSFAVHHLGLWIAMHIRSGDDLEILHDGRYWRLIEQDGVNWRLFHPGLGERTVSSARIEHVRSKLDR